MENKRTWPNVARTEMQRGFNDCNSVQYNSAHHRGKHQNSTLSDRLQCYSSLCDTTQSQLKMYCSTACRGWQRENDWYTAFQTSVKIKLTKVRITTTRGFNQEDKLISKSARTIWHLLHWASHFQMSTVRYVSQWHGNKSRDGIFKPTTNIPQWLYHWWHRVHQKSPWHGMTWMMRYIIKNWKRRSRNQKTIAGMA